MHVDRRWLWLILSLIFGLSAGWLAYWFFARPVSVTVPSQRAEAKAEPVRGLPVVPLKDGVIVKATGAIPESAWTLNALGDVMIGRAVYQQILQKGVNYPFEALKKQISDADLTTADQESAISDAQTVLCNSCMSFVSPARVTDGLKYAGVDAVSLANNHSYNGGQEGFIDTMVALKRRGIKYFGGGRNFSEAHSAHVIDIKGSRVALLGYNAISGGSSATESLAGMAEVSLAPWEPWNETEAVQMEKDIKVAAKLADVVLVYYHWGTEYTHVANAEQRRVAQRAVDAGATMVIGTHPHWVQGIEWYKGKLITYSLGNFVFDQEWSLKTKQGTFLKAAFDGDKLIRAELVPYRIEDFAQPRPVSLSEAKQILADVFAHSWWPKE